MHHLILLFGIFHSLKTKLTLTPNSFPPHSDINLFHTTGLNQYSLKILENHWFPDVFRV